MNFDRRSLIKGGAALGLGASAGLLDYAKAWAQASPFKAEPNARLNMMRWKRFVEAEDVQFMKLVAAFEAATGAKINITNESYDDIQPKASVVANTGQGLDMVWGLYSLPHLFPQKCLDVTDVADYLGKAHGGWFPAAEKYGKSGDKWIAVPIATTGSLINYRIAACEKAGFKEFPKDTAGFLELCKALKANNTPAGMAFGHASGDANGWMHWLLWTFGGNLVDANDKVIINSPETAKALEYGKALYDTFIPGTAAWNDSSNNKAFLAGELFCTNNGISIYVTAKKEKPELAADMNHAYMPVGPIGKPTELHLSFPILTFSFTKYPNTCKAFIAFMLDSPNFNPWMGAAEGYLSHFLAEYDANPVWTADPKTTPYRDVSKRTLTPAGLGTLGEKAAAAVADFIVVDMFANYVTGREDVKGAIASAERQAKRIYR
ncbi:carbohydrate ABC transporter substrate-binding protein [Bosea caraganae]|uniref:Carbohydrate ABC transporter substrate-binding protein n=1 Tax=Bosea caraganae TaxID=2763117 RepID=A0A370L2M4_9HYPH|nr:ABC transporter substrate-binding protein [Bosea caraganae]RDJ22478.1 carbohydrate ABC transporter substrate-binding protein [Bosea caraganae]RDJ30437.1 carbohydrate ABC transporter substrate-binding protein [Bosea caraganae]